MKERARVTIVGTTQTLLHMTPSVTQNCSSTTTLSQHPEILHVAFVNFVENEW